MNGMDSSAAAHRQSCATSSSMKSPSTSSSGLASDAAAITGEHAAASASTHSFRAVMQCEAMLQLITTSAHLAGGLGLVGGPALRRPEREPPADDAAMHPSLERRGSGSVESLTPRLGRPISMAGDL